MHLDAADSRLDEMFGALADPTRRAIIARLVKGDATVSELVKPSGFSQPTISGHVKVLERAGLVSRLHIGQTRPVRLNGEALKAAGRWIGDHHAFWEESLDRLGEHVQQLKAEGKF